MLVARRFDYLGGRLMSLCLALLAGREKQIPVKLTWPISPLHGMPVKAEDVFAQRFLDEHLITEQQVRADNIENSDDCTMITALNPKQMPSDLSVAPLPPFADVLPVSVFSDPLRGACELLATQDYRAVHVRHGDLVRGNWRHFGHMDRFVPYDATHDFILRHCPAGEFRVHSDESEAAVHLTDVARAAGDGSFNYVQSDPTHGLAADVFDAFNMAFAQKIIAPANSAYSGFAALYLAREKRAMPIKAFTTWAKREVEAPKVSIDAAYTAKRHLFIVETLHRTGSVAGREAAIERLLDHVEDTYPDTAEVFAARLRLYDALPQRKPFEELAQLFVSRILSVSGKKLLRPGMTHLSHLKKDAQIAGQLRHAEVLQAQIAHAQTIINDPAAK